MKRLPSVTLLAGLALLGACSLGQPSRSAGERASGQLITAEMIEKSGVSTGWDVLRHFANHLAVSDATSRGQMRATRRGQESIYLNEDPLLVIDGTRGQNFRMLASIPARDIQSMRILSAMEAATQFGTRAASGAIVVQTIKPSPPL